MLKEFKEFAVKGNVVDMAVGIIIGGAFTTIVKSLVSDVLMPPIGLLLGGVDFSQFFVVLKEGAKAAGPYATLSDANAAGAVTISYGVFINSVVSFVIVAFATFMLVRSINRLKRKEEAAPKPAPSTKECPECFSAIAIKAKRCPCCTSVLPVAAEEAQ
ncbi:large conductance mechanosensitive channel protein MscL [Gallaecimonas pentaromativorans]|uniref:large conductance mechanosensitive channel protein MscL n=1 Tax=Gallaecimonas pentaromativorans TaxID=584787 RepID=UPI00067F6C0F|nr:large conductance mechanosensitive channel protein MscL [Gallaecimonas pentaromativorans]